MGISVGSLTLGLAPLEPLTLPRGIDGQPPRTFAPREMTLGMAQLAERVDAGEDGTAAELLRQCLPGITDAEANDLTLGEVLWVFRYCARQLPPTAGGAGGAPSDGGSAPSAPPRRRRTARRTAPATEAPAP